jgi:hypothetical protein
MEGTKNGSRFRLGVPEELLEILRWHEANLPEGPMRESDLLFPSITGVVGDFAGPKALRAVGNWIRRMDTQVHVFYVSNVEQYLFQQGEAWQRFYGNVSELPLHSAARFIRSVSNRGFPRQHPLARSASHTSSVREVLDLFRFGRLQSYADIVDLTR